MSSCHAATRSPRASAKPRFVHRSSCASSSCTQRRCARPHGVSRSRRDTPACRRCSRPRSTISSIASPPKRRQPSTARRSTASLLNVGMTTLKAGRDSPSARSAAGIGLQVERERRVHRARNDARGQEARAGSDAAVAHRRPPDSSGAPGHDRDVAEACPLERAAQRRGRKVIHVHEVVGEVGRVAATSERASSFLATLRRARSAP